MLFWLSHEHEEGCCNCSRKLSVGFKEEVMRGRISPGDELSVTRVNGVFAEPTELCMVCSDALGRYRRYRMRLRCA